MNSISSQFGVLGDVVDVDVAVLRGGIAGLTTALLLKNAGRGARAVEGSVPDQWFDYIQRDAVYHQRAQS